MKKLCTPEDGYCVAVLSITFDLLLQAVEEMSIPLLEHQWSLSLSTSHTEISSSTTLEVCQNKQNYQGIERLKLQYTVGQVLIA